MKNLNKKGFSHVELFIVLIVVFLVGGAGFYVFKRSSMGKISEAESRQEASVNKKVVIEAGALSSGGPSGPDEARSPVEIVACRMSDTPYSGENRVSADRVYVGARPVVTQQTAADLNKFWDKYFPDYHIDSAHGKDVTYAADYTLVTNVGFTANYIVDSEKPTDTKDPYSTLYKPSEAMPGLLSGKYNTDTIKRSVSASQNPQGKQPFRIKRIYDYATIYGRDAQFYEKDYSAVSRTTSPNSGRGGLGTSGPGTNAANDLAISPGKLPGKTTWSYINGPVATIKRGSKSRNISDHNIINNPNPLVQVKVTWASGRTVDGLENDSGGSGYPLTESASNVFRFQSLPKCNNAPGTYTRSIAERRNEAIKFNRIWSEQDAKANAAITAQGIDLTRAQEVSTNTKLRNIRTQHGISPLMDNSTVGNTNSALMQAWWPSTSIKNAMMNKYYWSINPN